MTALTKNNANERCRTCLCKLIKDEDTLKDGINGDSTFQTKFVDIKSNKEVQEMLRRYIFLENEADLLNKQSYPQYICIDCLKQLQTFETFRNKALESARKLSVVFSEELYVHKIELNDDGVECKKNLEDQLSGNVKDEDVFNLFLNDSLIETEEFLLQEPDIYDDFHNTDPDPFQSTQKQGKRRKTRGRRAKQNSVDTLTNNKYITRKSKKNNNSLEESETHNNKTITEQIAKVINDEGEVSDLQDSTFQDDDHDSSDDKILSNKIVHSKRISKERKAEERESVINSKEENQFSNYKFGSESFVKDSHVRQEEKINITSEIDSFETGKQSADNFKTELDCDSLSSDSDFNTRAQKCAPTITTEKKKRHCILNSGRRIGLSNSYKCDQCQHKFGHKVTLEAHIRKVHEGQKKAFKCEMCDKAYSFIGGLSTHIRDVHERKQDSYDCTVPGCDKKYSNFMTLQRHVRFKHLNMEPTHLYVCEQCGATFKQSSNLRYHMKTRHPTEEDLKRKELMPKDRLECEECKKSFHSQYTLKYHKLRVHADEKKFECKICGRRVAKQFMLDSHMLVHSDQKLACTFCGREFVRKYQVEAHIRAVHQKLKPFQCPHCSESFASRKTLRHHIYIHTGEKPYVCDICGQAYRQPTCLKNHRKIHNKLCSNDAPTSVSVNRNF